VEISKAAYFLSSDLIISLRQGQNRSTFITMLKTCFITFNQHY